MLTDRAQHLLPGQQAWTDKDYAAALQALQPSQAPQSALPAYNLEPFRARPLPHTGYQETDCRACNAASRKDKLSMGPVTAKLLALKVVPYFQKLSVPKDPLCKDSCSWEELMGDPVVQSILHHIQYLQSKRKFCCPHTDCKFQRKLSLMTVDHLAPFDKNGHFTKNDCLHKFLQACVEEHKAKKQPSGCRLGLLLDRAEFQPNVAALETAPAPAFSALQGEVANRGRAVAGTGSAGASQSKAADPQGSEDTTAAPHGGPIAPEQQNMGPLGMKQAALQPAGHPEAHQKQGNRRTDGQPLSSRGPETMEAGFPRDYIELMRSGIPVEYLKPHEVEMLRKAQPMLPLPASLLGNGVSEQAEQSAAPEVAPPVEFVGRAGSDYITLLQHAGDEQRAYIEDLQANAPGASGKAGKRINSAASGALVTKCHLCQPFLAQQSPPFGQKSQELLVRKMLEYFADTQSLMSNRVSEELDTQTNLAALELPIVQCILCHLSYSKVCQNKLCQQKYPKQGQLLKEHLARPTNYANSCQYPNQWCLYAILQEFAGGGDPATPGSACLLPELMRLAGFLPNMLPAGLKFSSKFKGPSTSSHDAGAIAAQDSDAMRDGTAAQVVGSTDTYKGVSSGHDSTVSEAQPGLAAQHSSSSSPAVGRDAAAVAAVAGPAKGQATRGLYDPLPLLVPGHGATQDAGTVLDPELLAALSRGTAMVAPRGAAVAGTSATAVAGPNGAAVADPRGTSVAGASATAVASSSGSAAAGPAGTTSSGSAFTTAVGQLPGTAAQHPAGVTAQSIGSRTAEHPVEENNAVLPGAAAASGSGATAAAQPLTAAAQVPTAVQRPAAAQPRIAAQRGKDTSRPAPVARRGPPAQRGTETPQDPAAAQHRDSAQTRTAAQQGTPAQPRTAAQQVTDTLQHPTAAQPHTAAHPLAGTGTTTRKRSSRARGPPWTGPTLGLGNTAALHSTTALAPGLRLTPAQTDKTPGVRLAPALTDQTAAAAGQAGPAAGSHEPAAALGLRRTATRDAAVQAALELQIPAGQGQPGTAFPAVGGSDAAHMPSVTGSVSHSSATTMDIDTAVAQAPEAPARRSAETSEGPARRSAEASKGPARRSAEASEAPARLSARQQTASQSQHAASRRSQQHAAMHDDPAAARRVTQQSALQSKPSAARRTAQQMAPPSESGAAAQATTSDAVQHAEQAAAVPSEALPSQEQAAVVPSEALPDQEQAAVAPSEALPDQEQAAVVPSEALPDQEHVSPPPAFPGSVGRQGRSRKRKMPPGSQLGVQRVADAKKLHLDAPAAALSLPQRAPRMKLRSTPDETRMQELSEEAERALEVQTLRPPQVSSKNQPARRQNPKRGKSKWASRQTHIEMAPDVEEGVHLLLGLTGIRPH